MNDIKLTAKAKKVLLALVQDCSRSDAEIAKSLRMKTKEVSAFKSQLRQKGIITGYHAGVDLEKAGISVIALVVYKPTAEYFKKFGTSNSKYYSFAVRNLMFRASLPDGRIMIMLAFRNVTDYDSAKNFMKTIIDEYTESSEVHTFHISSLTKFDYLPVIERLINDKNFSGIRDVKQVFGRKSKP